MLRLTLVCHGATAASRRALFSPAEEPLEAAALAQAEGLGPVLRNVDRALASPLLRARQTAAALCLDARADADLADLDCGRWAGRGVAEVQKEEPEALAAWLTDADAAPHGGETRAGLGARVGGWMRRQEAGRGHLAAVTHAAVIRAAVLRVLDAPPDAFWRIDVAPLTLTDLRFDGRRWALRALGAPLPRAMPETAQAPS